MFSVYSTVTDMWPDKNKPNAKKSTKQKEKKK